MPASSNFDEKLFNGLYQEKIICKNSHVTELPVQKLPEILMIPILGHTIQSCLDNYLMDEDIERKCSDCINNSHVKQTHIIAEPSTLIIQLKRFHCDSRSGTSMKRKDSIEIEKTIKMVTGSSYRILSIINHFGDTPEEGHYNVLIYDAFSDSYILVDDQYVKKDVKITQDLKTSSYIIIFEKDN